MVWSAESDDARSEPARSMRVIYPLPSGRLTSIMLCDRDDASLLVVAAVVREVDARVRRATNLCADDACNAARSTPAN